MNYTYCKLNEVYSVGGIVFVQLIHNKTGIVANSYLGEHILTNPHFLNLETILKKMDDLKNDNNNMKKSLNDTIFLQIQQDLIKIYKEFV